MQALFENYLQSISSKFSRKETSEMGYRTDFEILIKKIFESIKVQEIDHDPKASQGNKPDFAIIKHEIPILYIETKDIGISLDKVEKSEQMARYFGYTNLVLTDYLEFRFYRNGQNYGEPIKIGNYDLKTRIITPNPKSFDNLAKTLLDFTKSHKEPIKSGKHLSKIMGGKAQRIRDNIKEFLSLGKENNSDLTKLYRTIKELLVHDLKKDSFADMYAQTLVYGLFVARYHDKTLGSFSSQEARELIPNSNPLLKRFFDHIIGANFDTRLKYIIDELCEVFSHADVKHLMKEYFNKDLWGETEKGPDPVIHFYEDFLKEYDPRLRKKLGAYYTPQPIVQFIVKSVDHLLKKEFKLSNGLADSSKTKDGLHKVQILDPAVGTGTFISAVIGIIYESLLKAGQKGRWPAYVHHDLLPRIYGFELMMTPYIIAHLKLGIAFKQTGFWDFHRRLGIYLTNSLEEPSKQQEMFAFGLAESIAEESKEAAVIKNEKPIMVVIGNPPYSISSSNKGKWIQEQIEVYKKDLNERKINIDDDYIKFIRFAEHFIEKNKTGIVAMITNNSFIDGITHRQMRKHLLETFDDIYILDLHGDAKESAPDGIKDQNVFEIQQGVSINIFVRKNIKKESLGNLYHSEIFESKKGKYSFLNKNSIKSVKWNGLKYSKPYYFFVPKDFKLEEKYQKGFQLDELFLSFSSGIQTKKDRIAIQFNKKKLERIIQDFLNLDENNLRLKYKLKDTSGWNIRNAKNDLKTNKFIYTQILYRPFDIRETIYTQNSGGFIGRPRVNISKHFINNKNIGLIANRQFLGDYYSHVGVTNKIICHGTFYLGNKGQDYLFPLYLFDDNELKTSNLKTEIVSQIEKIVGKTTPENIFDYIYAVLHSPNYREKYKEFLKIDFPRISYPKNPQSFKKLVKLGKELRLLHLFESPKINKPITTYPIGGSNIVEKPIYKDKKVFINKKQYFGKIPEVAWNFYIGGYQPAQKWLKDRKGRELTNKDIEHYQKIIVVLIETEKLMKKIDKSQKND